MSMLRDGCFGATPPPIHWASDPSGLPAEALGTLENEIVSSCTGPDIGLRMIEQKEMPNGFVEWSTRPTSSEKAFGNSISLYEQHPLTRRRSGDPIADSFAVVSRRNSAIVVVADGVNWGEKSMLAARCAVFGSIRFLEKMMYSHATNANCNNKTDSTSCNRIPLKTSRHLGVLLREAVTEAHRTILEHGGGLTTVCACAVVPLFTPKRYAVVTCNVGDSLGFLYSRRWGVREITAGSRNLQVERNIRDALGAIGPVNGTDPELGNLTCSYCRCDEGDIVFLTSDGVSDNFDPVVCRLARPQNHSFKDIAAEAAAAAAAQPNGKTTNGTDHSQNHNHHQNGDQNGGTASKCDENSPTNLLPSYNISHNGSVDNVSLTPPNTKQESLPDLEPIERHIYSCKEMERVILEAELAVGTQPSAKDVVSALLEHVTNKTAAKRSILEDPFLYERLKPSERKRRESETSAALHKAAGKLDHATVVAYEVGKTLAYPASKPATTEERKPCSASLISIEELLNDKDERLAPLASITEIEFETVL